MSWWSHAPSFLLATALLFLPGAAVAWAAGLRWLALFAAAPAITVSAVGTAAVVSSSLGVPWSVWSCLATAAILTAAAALTLGRSRASSRHGLAAVRPAGQYGAVVVAAAVLAAALIGGRMLAAIGSPDSFSQTFDNVFHLNAIQYILDTGSGSSLTIGAMTGGGFYPAAWHDLVSLLLQLGGGSIPEAVNIVNLCIGALVWPAGCLYLTRAFAGPRPAALLCAGILSAAFGAYPLLMIDFGVLYPNFLALSLLPVALAFGAQALGMVPSDAGRVPAAVLLVGGVLPGLSLAHVSGTMTLLPLLAPAAIMAWWRWHKQSTGHGRWWPNAGARVALLVGALAGSVVLWSVVRPPEEAATWPPVASPGQAVLDVLTSSGINRPESWAVMLFSLLGLGVVVLRRQQLWLAGAYVAGAALFLAAVSMHPGRIRTFLTGVWYNDPQRLAAVLPIVILPVAVIGAVYTWDFVHLAGRRLRDRRIQPTKSFSPRNRVSAGKLATAVAAAAALVVATQHGNVEAAQASAASKYSIGPYSPLVSADELAVLERLGREVPEDAIIVGNPWNGSSLAYAIANRRTVQLHILGATSDDAMLIYARLNQAASDPQVCAAVRRLDATFVLDFGHREVNDGEGRSTNFAGLDDLAERGVAEPVDTEGSATLYRITACR
ncbi:MAG: hypothetical protein JWM01_1608 [Arthrobacter sp.]|jgi:hypothetical protein|nr:hypothetical protein [Arthrobacter sp.]